MAQYARGPASDAWAGGGAFRRIYAGLSRFCSGRCLQYGYLLSNGTPPQCITHPWGLRMETIPDAGSPKLSRQVERRPDGWKVVLVESKLEDGRYHCTTGPAHMVWHVSPEASKHLVLAHWYVEGRRHRLDGPAIRQWHFEQTASERFLVHESWWRVGCLHRDGDLPARLDWQMMGRTKHLVREEWRICGSLHREGGHASRRWELGDGQRSDGRPWLAEEQWCFHGLRHREDGPSWRQWTAHGQYLLQEEWTVRGELHRRGGPAYCQWMLSEVTNLPFLVWEEWWLDGQRHRDEPFRPALSKWMFTPDGCHRHLLESEFYVNGKASRCTLPPKSSAGYRHSVYGK